MLHFGALVKRVYPSMGGNARYTPRPTKLEDPSQHRSAMNSLGVHTSGGSYIEGLDASGDAGVFANINTIVCITSTAGLSVPENREEN